MLESLKNLFRPKKDAGDTDQTAAPVDDQSNNTTDQGSSDSDQTL